MKCWSALTSFQTNIVTSIPTMHLLEPVSGKLHNKSRCSKQSKFVTRRSWRNNCVNSYSSWSNRIKLHTVSKGLLIFIDVSFQFIGHLEFLKQ